MMYKVVSVREVANCDKFAKQLIVFGEIHNESEKLREMLKGQLRKVGYIIMGEGMDDLSLDKMIQKHLLGPIYYLQACFIKRLMLNKVIQI